MPKRRKKETNQVNLLEVRQELSIEKPKNVSGGKGTYASVLRRVLKGKEEMGKSGPTHPKDERGQGLGGCGCGALKENVGFLERWKNGETPHRSGEGRSNRSNQPV